MSFAISTMTGIVRIEREIPPGEVVSATGTVGLSTGITSADLPAMLKGVLCVDMLMGRLEIIAWMVLIYRSTWFGRRMEAV